MAQLDKVADVNDIVLGGEDTVSPPEQQPLASPDVAAYPISNPRFIFSFVVLFVLFALDFAARIGVSAAFPAMQQSLGLTDSQVGIIGSAVLIGMATFVLPFSFASDRGEKKKVVAIMGIIWGLGSIISGLTSSFIALLAGRFFVGMGNAGYAPVSVSMLTSWVKRSSWGLVIGFYNAAMNCGIALGTALSALLVVKYGWRSPFYAIGALTFVFVVAALFLPKTSKGCSEVEKKESVSLAEAASVTLKNKTVMMFGIAIGCANTVAAALLAWAPSYYVRYHGWEGADIGKQLGTLYLVVGLIMMPVSGFVADKLGKWNVRSRAWLGVPCMSMAALGAIYTFSTGSIVGFYVFMGCFMAPISAIHTATQELVPSRYKASSYGVYVLLLQGIGALGPIIAGFLSEKFELRQALIMMQFGLVITVVLLFIAGFTYMGDFNRARAMEANSSLPNS